jgi:hypothetical protein
MKPNLYLALDPGASGGIAFIPENGNPWAVKMPDSDKDLFDLLVATTVDYAPVAVLELVHSMPKQGVSSSFTFGEGYGKLQMALIGAGIPFERVTPQKWQKALGCLTKGDKNVSKRKAQELFPSIQITHAIADALLIAEYCRRKEQGKL